ncbi:MAG: glycosyltransferase family 2 protein [Planctomycetaceae bacterium]
MNHATGPAVSVIMAACDNDKYIAQAIASVQNQTLTSWELIIMDDVSNDDSYAVAKDIAATDPRIMVHRMARNEGAGAARDAAIRLAAGKFLAIFDADDICEPTRLEEQVAFLSNHPDVVAVGTQTVQVDQYGNQIGTKTFPTDPELLYRMMYTAIPIQLPTLMVNLARIPYDFTWFEGWRYSEDSLLFFKLSCFGKLANLSRFLVKYRYHAGSSSYRHAKRYFYKTWHARKIARTLYAYRPRVSDRLVSVAQFVFVTCLPSACIPRVYRFVRTAMLAFSGSRPARLASGHANDAFD